MTSAYNGADPENLVEATSPLDEQLESVRDYLTWVAGRTLDPSLTAKLGASDIVQETFIEARRRAPTYRGHCLGQLRAWLESILRHRIARERRRFLRSAKRDARRERALLRPDPDGSRVTMDPAADGPTPSGQFMRRELIDALVLAIDRLPAHYQQVVRLRHEERRSFDQIAKELNISPDAARKLWARALVRLRDALRAGHDPR
jgi:RNA polymerase sigma-70 factor (ECF subfamily)